MAMPILISHPTASQSSIARDPIASIWCREREVLPGRSHRIHFQSASSPVFTPDGKHILFWGRPSGIDDRGSDWWVFSLADGTLVQTGVKVIVRAAEKLP